MEPVVNLEIDPEPRADPIMLETRTKSLVDQPGFLPEIPIKKKRETKSIVPPPQKIDLTYEDDSDTSTTNIDQMRRASKRAIHLLMKNMKAK